MQLRERIDALKAIECPSVHHPESNQFFHTMQVTLNAVGECNDPDIITAAALHDIGKAVCFPETRNTHGHEKLSADIVAATMAERVSTVWGLAERATVVWLIENHLRVMHWASGEMTAGKAMKLASHPAFGKLVMLRRFDLKGRDPDFPATWVNIARFQAILENLSI